MSFAIRMGIPEMLDLWTDLSKKKAAGTISKKELALYNKWGKAMRLLSKDPSYPSLHTHDIEPLTKRYGVKVWQSYLENNTSRAMRMYWVYGSDRQDITSLFTQNSSISAKIPFFADMLLSLYYRQTAPIS